MTVSSTAQPGGTADLSGVAMPGVVAVRGSALADQKQRDPCGDLDQSTMVTGGARRLEGDERR